MEFKIADHTHVSDIIKIIKGAQNALKDKGINQWQNGYPNTNTIKNDIDRNYSYVLLKDDSVVGTVAVIAEDEPTYETIYAGKWLTKEDYIVIHRIAVDPQYYGLGLGTEIIKHVEEICRNKEIKSIKIDTHKENISMQNVLIKNGFEYCGIIYLENGDERIAFEKIVKGESK